MADLADDTGSGAPPTAELRRSSRDRDEVRARLTTWLAARLPDGAGPRITALEGTDANGMSNETLLFDATWDEDGVAVHQRLVARLAPGEDDIPVFTRYDLPAQFETIRLVGELSDVPVPPVLWSEPGSAAIGSPFFVMARVDGRVPPDVMPYTFGDNWLFDAPATDQRRLQDATLDVIARLHAIADADHHFAFLAPDAPGATPLRRRMALTQRWYDFAARDGFRSDLVERTLAWLGEHWPREGDEAPVLCWGDSRIGNVLYDGFAPAAVLDWELATLGPRELDIAWLIYAHRIFEDIAGTFGLGGMPQFLRADDVAGTYARLTGHEPRHLDWFGTYAAVQYAIVFLRTGARAVHFGETEMPDRADDLILNAEPLERMLAGTYWS